MKTHRLGVYVAIPFLAVALAACGKETKQASGVQQRRPEVEVVEIHLQNLPWKETYPARVEGVRSAEIRSRVGGIIVKRSYVEGSFVKEGDELFKIDPVPFEIALEKAQADHASALAREKQAGADFARIDKLFASGSVSDKQHDDAVAAYDLAKAATMAAHAALRQAEVNLGYTSVSAPFSGVTGKETMTEGNLVSSADILTVVTQLDPIYVLFSLPEGDPAFRQLFAKGSRHKEGSTAMTLFTRSGSAYGRPGQVNFAETGVDPQTGSVRMRAEFPNDSGELLPGQVVRLAFADLKLEPCAVIPADAVIMSPMGAIVYTVDAENKVAPRPVQLGPVLKEGQLVTGGLAEGDRVIITSLIRLKPGNPVVPRSAGRAAASAPSNNGTAETPASSK